VSREDGGEVEAAEGVWGEEGGDLEDLRAAQGEHRGFDIPKASPESVVRAIFDGVENGEEDIFPDPMSQSIADTWRGGAANALERQNSALLEAASVTS